MGLVSDPSSNIADSYVSWAEAELILGSRPYTNAWDALGSTPSAEDWVATGAHAIGETVIPLSGGSGVFEAGTVIQFAGHDRSYSVTDPNPASFAVSPALVSSVSAGEAVTRVTLNEREKFLRFSTTTLDAQVAWKGEIAKSDQPLRWPRLGVYDCDGRLYCGDCFPDDLKILTATFALALAQRDTTQTPGLMGLGFKRAKADVLEVEVDPTQVISTMPDYVKDYLGCMGTYKSGTGRRGGVVQLDRM